MDSAAALPRRNWSWEASTKACRDVYEWRILICTALIPIEFKRYKTCTLQFVIHPPGDSMFNAEMPSF